MSPYRQSGDEEDGWKSDVLKCLFCPKRVSVTRNYASHLKIHHKIRYDIEGIIKQTEEYDKKGKGRASPSKFTSDDDEEMAQIENDDQEKVIPPLASPTRLPKVPTVELQRTPSHENVASKQNEEEVDLAIGESDVQFEPNARGPLGIGKKNLEVTPTKRRKISDMKDKHNQFENYDVPICAENFLTFICNAKDCSESYDEAKDLVNHIQTCHKLTKEFAPCFREYGLFITTFKCELCDVKISKQKSSLVRHLSNHKLTLEQYQQRVLEEKRHTKVLINSFELSDFDSWLIGECVYACFLCSQEIKGSTSFWNHVQDLHNQDKSVYTENNGDSLLEEKSTFCALCLEELLHEEESISSHMETVHNLTPLEYFKKHLVKRQKPNITLSQLRCSILYECQFCDFTSKWVKKFKLHVDTMHVTSFTNYTLIFRRSLAEMSLHECLICQKVIFLFESSIDNHLLSHNMVASDYHEKFFEQEENRPHSPKQLLYKGPLKNHPALQTNDKIYKAWLAKFAFDCPECETKEYSRNDIASHIKIRHHGHIQKTQKAKKRSVFRCKLCKKYFQFILTNIDNHLRDGHALTIDQYYYNHVRIPFTYSIWSSSPPWKCEICNYTDVAKEFVQQHLKIAHDTNDQSRLQVIDIHECALCKAKVNHDCMSLNEHANTHSLDLKTYYVSKVSRNFPSNINPRSRGTDDNSETENALEIDTSTSSSPSKTVDGRPIPYSAVSGEQVPVSVGEDCSIVPSQLELFDIPNLESDCFFLPALQPSETRFKDFNQCIFYCKICESKFPSFKIVKNHLASAHSMTLGKFLERFAPLNWEVTMYTCPVCNKLLLKDLYIAETHMVTQHDSSLCCITKPSFFDSPNLVKSKSKTASGEVSKKLTITSKEPEKLTNDFPNRAFSVVTPQISSLTQPLQTQKPEEIFPIQGLSYGSQTHQSSLFPNPLAATYSQLQLALQPNVPQNLRGGHLIIQQPIRQQNYGSLQMIPASQQQIVAVSTAATINSSHLFTSSQTNSNAPNSGQNHILTFVRQPFQSISTLRQPVANFSTEQIPQKRIFQWNNCFFFCGLCPMAFTKYGIFVSHVTFNHMPMKDYELKYTIIEQEVMHTCLECDQLVKCTKDDVMEHLFSQHASTLESYEKKYYIVLCKVFDNLKEQLVAARNSRK